MAAVTIYSDFGAQKNKVCHCFHCFPIYLPLSEGTRCHDLRFLNVEFQASFLSLLFHFNQNALQFLLAFCHKMVLSVCLRLLIISPGNLDSRLFFISLLLRMTCSAYKLNKQGDNIQP